MDIVLSTINARYAHCAFALRYLRANLGALRDRSEIVEFTHQTSAGDIAEALLARRPRVVALSVYLWNVERIIEVAGILKAVRPDLPIVVGGPEVSYELEGQPLARLADVVVQGEGEAIFESLCRDLLAGERPARVIAAPAPDIGSLKLPYAEYSDTDLRDRVLYVEASRGCPFRCEFCLSSLDVAVRNVPLDALLAEFDTLLARGARQFKFIDRTFNLKIAHSVRILQFFLDRYRPGLFLHFEMIPDRLPQALRELIARFPSGALQFEVGVQSLDDAVSERISRRQDVTKLEQNLAFLRDHTGVHVHADLIVGLPGEDLGRFAAGFDRLHAMRPQEIQVGILKRLRGTPIARHTATHGMRYRATPPYDVLQTDVLSFEQLQRMKRFALVWDRTVNSANFAHTAPLIWRGTTPFAGFMTWVDWLHAALGQVHAISLKRLGDQLQRFLIQARGLPQADVQSSLERDIERRAVARRTGQERQARHRPRSTTQTPIRRSLATIRRSWFWIGPRGVW